MGGLAHYLESAGLATTHISLVREQTEKINPPRALWVPFELGRPLGAPDDPAFQRRVVMAALKLLEAPSGPLLEDFPDDAPGAAEFTGWACPINLAAGDTDSPLLAEVGKLRNWYDLGVARRGRTTVGASGLAIEAAAGFLAAFLDDPTTPSPCDGLSAAACLKLSLEDLKAYYLEAATAKPAGASSKDLADWFWGDTVAGETLIALRAHCLGLEGEDMQRLGNLTIVPRAQLHRT